MAEETEPKILLVEDNDGYAWACTECFKGYAVSIVRTAQEAINLLKDPTKKFVLAVLDKDLEEGSSGADVAAHIVQQVWPQQKPEERLPFVTWYTTSPWEIAEASACIPKISLEEDLKEKHKTPAAFIEAMRRQIPALPRRDTALFL